MCLSIWFTLLLRDCLQIWKERSLCLQIWKERSCPSRRALAPPLSTTCSCDGHSCTRPAWEARARQQHHLLRHQPGDAGAIPWMWGCPTCAKKHGMDSPRRQGPMPVYWIALPSALIIWCGLEYLNFNNIPLYSIIIWAFFLWRGLTCWSFKSWCNKHSLFINEILVLCIPIIFE